MCYNHFYKKVCDNLSMWASLAITKGGEGQNLNNKCTHEIGNLTPSIIHTAQPTQNINHPFLMKIYNFN